MKLGAFDIHPVTDGQFRLDGGAMFGGCAESIVGGVLPCRRAEPHRIGSELSADPGAWKTHSRKEIRDHGAIGREVHDQREGRAGSCSSKR